MAKLSARRRSPAHQESYSHRAAATGSLIRCGAWATVFVGAEGAVVDRAEAGDAVGDAAVDMAAAERVGPVDACTVCVGLPVPV
jgi:hypothetical protein